MLNVKSVKNVKKRHTVFSKTIDIENNDNQQLFYEACSRQESITHSQDNATQFASKDRKVR